MQNPQSTMQQAPEKVIILIGPSQMGKSSLGTFLANKIVGETPVFAIGDGQRSCTADPAFYDMVYEREVIVGTVQEMDNIVASAHPPPNHKGKRRMFKEKLESATGQSLGVHVATSLHPIRLVDTAGVGDNKDLEAQNMLGLFQLLADTKMISCAVLVVKFPSFITPQWQANLHFYRDLLPQMFTSNVILVVTGFPDDEKWIAKQSRSGTNPRKTLEILCKEVRDALKLSYDLPVFHLDTLTGPEDEEVYDRALITRRSILEYALAVDGLALKAQMFPKPLPWKTADQNAIRDLQNHRKGITKGLEVAESGLAKKSQEAVKILQELENKQRSLSTATKELESKDNENYAVIRSRQYTDESHILKWWGKQDFDESTDFTIVSRTWSAGNPKYNIDSEDRVKGTVASDFWGDLNAVLTLYTTNREFYQGEIDILRLRVRELGQDIMQIRATYNSIMDDKKDIDSKTRNLHKELTDINSKIAELEAPRMTLSQMKSRLQRK